MKNAKKAGFIAVCLFVCIIPFAGMAVKPADISTENRALADFPKIREAGEWNIDFMRDMGMYFEDHFAFRTVLVSADAEIQSRVFGVSNVDTVTVGKNGWLYYTASVDDYLGRNTISERKAFNAAHNLSLIQRYVQEQGASFLLTVPPNKNSLYGENMPYYLRQKAGNVKFMDLLEQEIKKQGISYADLFALFEEQEETVYLKRDSHWNQKGALLAYDALLNELEIEHDRYETAKILRLKNEYGDLNKMLYPLTAEPEWNTEYQKEDAFIYKTEPEDVESAWIETENENGEGTLLMFRDSFGNTLLPYMANTFSKGYFSRSVPENVTEYMERCHPDAVVFEKVERNAQDFAETPPLMEGPEASAYLGEPVKTTESGASIQVLESENHADYWEISGVLDEKAVSEEGRIYVRVKEKEEEHTYEAFTVSTEETDYGYCLYLLKDKIQSGEVEVEVLAETKDGLREAGAKKTDLRELSETK